MSLSKAAGPQVAGISAGRYFLVALVVAVAIWALLFFMPDDPYQRYKATVSTDYIKAGWIYERLNFDPTPVDIAFVGSSRSLEGIDSHALEDALNADATPKLHVVNLATPGIGNDVPYLLGRMLLRTKQPRFLFIETDYLDFPAAHPGFPLLADAQDVIDAPLFINFQLPTDLLWLPARNLRELCIRLWNGGPPRFDPSTYRGPHWEDVYQTTGRDGELTQPRLYNMELPQFRHEADLQIRSIVWKAQQYDNWAWLQLRYNDIYLQRLMDLARAAGVRVVLLYEPPVGAPKLPYREAMFRQYGEIWTMPDEVTADHTLWGNTTHLNFRGAERFTAWLAQRLRTVAR